MSEIPVCTGNVPFLPFFQKIFERPKKMGLGLLVHKYHPNGQVKKSIWLIILVTKVAGFSGFRIRFSKFQKMVLFWHFDVCFLAKMV
jgi:hypothetical protein